MLVSIFLSSLLFLAGCTEKVNPPSNQKKVEIFHNKHLIIEKNIDESIGFIPDKAMTFDSKESYKQKINIDGEEAIYYKIPKKKEYFDFNFIIDTMKKQSKKDVLNKKFKIFIFQDGEFVDFWVNNKNVKHYNVDIPNNSSVKIPIAVKTNLHKEYSDILVIAVDLDVKNNKNEHINASKILVSRKNIKENIEDYKGPFDNGKLNLREQKSNTDEIGGIDLLNEENSSVHQILKADFLKINQTPIDTVQDIMIFDIDGNIYPILKDQSKAIILKRKKNEDVTIPLNNKIKTDKRLFLLINNNPDQLAFKHLKELQNHKIDKFLNYTDVVEIGN